MANNFCILTFLRMLLSLCIDKLRSSYKSVLVNYRKSTWKLFSWISGITMNCQFGLYPLVQSCLLRFWKREKVQVLFTSLAREFFFFTYGFFKHEKCRICNKTKHDGRRIDKNPHNGWTTIMLYLLNMSHFLIQSYTYASKTTDDIFEYG